MMPEYKDRANAFMLGVAHYCTCNKTPGQPWTFLPIAVTFRTLPKNMSNHVFSPLHLSPLCFFLWLKSEEQFFVTGYMHLHFRNVNACYVMQFRQREKDIQIANMEN